MYGKIRTYLEQKHIKEGDKDEPNWDDLWKIVNTLLLVEENENEAKDYLNDVYGIESNGKTILVFRHILRSCNYLFFTVKRSLINWIKQWLKTIVLQNCVHNMYTCPKGFYDVIFHSRKHQRALLDKVSVFFDNQLVHVM